MLTIVRAIILAAILVPCAASAQTFPNKPITLVVPYPPGGNADTAARIISPHMKTVLGQPVIVENRAGAGGMIAAEYVKNAKPDGYTLFMAANGPLLFSPMTMKRPDAYDWKKDFVPIGAVSITPMTLTVRKDVDVKSVDALIKKAASGQLLMASPGAGTTNHLAAELMKKQAHGNWRIVHYKGNAPAIASLIGGETQFSFDQLSVVLPYIKDGKVIPLAVTSARRVASLPDVPTLVESTQFKFQAVTFTGLLAPAGTPASIIDALAKALNETLNTADVKTRFEHLGAVSSPMKPSEFTSFLHDVDNTWRPVVADISAKR
jgi:tripartite-type tricarboxylate transporter receptor subunit TctC